MGSSAIHRRFGRRDWQNTAHENSRIDEAEPSCSFCVAQLIAMSSTLAQIHIKAPPKTKSFLQMAAELSGAASLTDYILRAALEQAHADMVEHQTFTFDQKAWDAFGQRLDAPARDLPELGKLLTNPDVFDRAS